METFNPILKENKFQNIIIDEDISELVQQMKALNPLSITNTVDLEHNQIHSNSLALDSDAEEYEQVGTNTNPFRNTKLSAGVEDVEGMNMEDAESCMSNLIHSIQSQAAVPEYALSDSVFNVDKPANAVALGSTLPTASIHDDQHVGDLLQLTVTEVYSPFQFWFQKEQEFRKLDGMKDAMNSFYRNAGSCWKLTPYFIKPGYICALWHDLIWQRARILSQPTTSASQLVSVHCVDYGRAAKVLTENLYFLHESFAEQPPLVRRGTLTDVYPLGLHWPPEATAMFRKLVANCELHADVKDVDLVERILFVNLWYTPPYNHQVSISSQMIEARLAGHSRNYSAESRAAHNGQRIRYIREHLPTFGMLESELFGTETEEFEDMFDVIIYNPTFSREFVPPKLLNPFRRGLQDALCSWLERFKQVELARRKLQAQHH